MNIPVISAPSLLALNHLLAHEPWARSRLERHAGKVACLDAGIAALRLKVAADGMLEPPAENETPAVTIRIRMSDVPLLLQNRERAFSYVRIEGDADFANAISQVSQSLKWDAEGDLARMVGDIGARRIVRGAGQALETVKSTHRTLAENLAEYLTEEQPVLTRPDAMADFAAEVARLRDDVERLGKRIARLEGSR